MRLKRILLNAVALALVVPFAARTAVASAPRPNVLFIMADDLNRWVGYLGRNQQAITPNMDRLSAADMSFTRACCAAPVCNPSRTALFSGLRPGSTGVFGDANDWRPVIAEDKTRITTLRRGGYEMLGAGKLCHMGWERRNEYDDYLKEDLDEQAETLGWVGTFNVRKLREFGAALDAAHGYKWNCIAADRQGNIGHYYICAARERNDSRRSNVPVDGSNSAAEWGRALTWRDLPHLVNPPSGYHVNCSTNPYTVTRDCPLKPAGFPRNLTSQSTELRSGTRAYRATELIEARPKHDDASWHAITFDLQTLTAQPFVTRILDADKSAGSKTADLAGRRPPAFASLKAWAKKIVDGKFHADSGSSWIQSVVYREGKMEAKTILPFGNSNNPAAPHWGDQMPLYAAQTMKPARLTRAEIEANAMSKLTMV